MSSTNRGAVRVASDFYATPESAFALLIPYLPHSEFWEPSCGDGRLIRILRESGREADGTDLSLGNDYLKDKRRRAFVITNPPFSLAQEFCQHAFNYSEEVMMLLRLNFLGAQKRLHWWRANEPRALFVLSKRPAFTENVTDSCEYAWFYWGNRMHGIRHL